MPYGREFDRILSPNRAYLIIPGRLMNASPPSQPRQTGPAPPAGAALREADPNAEERPAIHVGSR